MLVTVNSCPHCGAPINPGRSGGICAACALGDALSDTTERFDGHELQEEIARGGMGVVYRARQLDPPRDVALKTLLSVGLRSPSALERFRLETRAMASLQHPGILPVYTSGEQDGVPFFTMQLATGGTLAERSAEYAGAWRKLAELVAQLADAVQYAHERGVLHRDLKPGNVLFDEQGRAFVSDFGLAKLAEGGSDLTQTSIMIGTPRYLAPELVAKNGRAATTVSDVWGLGAILYELCAQRPPFEGDSTAALLRRIAEDAPAPLPRETPRDLGVIILKALAKNPAQRYASARELAEDLRRWIGGSPILARPATPLERMKVWTRRNPGLAVSFAVLAATLLVFALVEKRSVTRLQGALAQTQLREVRLQRASGNAGQRFNSLQTIADLTAVWPRRDLATLRTEAAAALALPDLRSSARWPVPHVFVTGTEAFSDDLTHYAFMQGDAFTIFDTASRRVVQAWRHPRASDARDFFFGPGLAWLGVQFADTSLELWPMDTNRAPFSARTTVAFHPAGESFFTVRDQQGLFLTSLVGGGERRILPPPLNHEPLLSDPVGERVFVVTGEPLRGVIARVRDGVTLATIPNPPRHATALDWSADGRWIALADGEPPYTITLHDAGTGEERARFIEHLMPVRKLHFHPASDSFVAVSGGHDLIWRSVEPDGFRVAMPASARALEFSRDGTRLGYCPGDGELGLLDVVASDVFRAWPEPPRDATGAAYTAAFSPDGRWTAVASDKSLRIWDARARRSVAVHPFGPRRAWWSTVFFAPGDPAQILWSVLGGGSWRAELDGSGQLLNPRRLNASADAMVQELADDGRSLVVIDGQGANKRADLWPEGDPGRARLLGRGIPFAGYRLLHGGQTGISTHFSEPDLWLWDAATGARLRSLGLKEPVASEPSPDGRWLLTGTRTEHILWDTAKWVAVARWPSRPGERDVWTPAFSPDSRLLAKASPTGEITVRRVPSGEEVLTLIPPRPLRLQQINFTPDGARLMMLQATGRFYEWDLARLRADLAKLGLGW